VDGYGDIELPTCSMRYCYCDDDGAPRISYSLLSHATALIVDHDQPTRMHGRRILRARLPAGLRKRPSTPPQLHSSHSSHSSSSSFLSSFSLTGTPTSSTCCHLKAMHVQEQLEAPRSIPATNGGTNGTAKITKLATAGRTPSTDAALQLEAREACKHTFVPFELCHC
jgi:hypothetical protein